MTIDLTDTTTGAILEALTQARRRLGGPASGMVLTLIIVTDEAASTTPSGRPARRAASIRAGCSRSSPASPRPNPGSTPRSGWATTGPGETILLRMYGPLGEHADSVVAPLLAPDVPVVTWWPDEAPASPPADPLGAVAQRRITDAAASEAPKDMLLGLATSYKPGDTDLSWTRSTPWRYLARRHPGPA